MNETDQNRGKRRQMIAEQIESRGIHSPRVLSAIEAVPREAFVPADSQPSAYDDRALTIAENQTISQPYIVALMTDALRIEPHHKVLEIGTGSGYQAAVLSRLTDHLYTVERHESLSRAAADRLRSLGVNNVQFHVGDGSAGWAQHAPFDRILVTAGAPSIPDPLIDQLADDGLLVIPIGVADKQSLTLLHKRAGRTHERVLIPCRFVKLIGQHGWT